MTRTALNHNSAVPGRNNGTHNSPSVNRWASVVINSLFLANFVVCFFSGSNIGWSSTDQDPLVPAKVKDIQKLNSSYNQCTSSATNDVKTGKAKPQDLPKAFSKCREKYPGAGLFLECKKNLLKNAKLGEVDPLDIAKCKRLLTAASFEPSDPMPLFVYGGQGYFAGLGLNEEFTFSEAERPNFTCERLRTAVSNIAQNAQHILFGNHPKMFLQGADQSRFIDELQALIARQPKTKKFNDIEGFGRIFGDPSLPQSIVYFPAAPCDYKGALGPIFTGVSLFYLPDLRKKSVYPYFGIAYYRQGQKNVTTPELVAEVSRRLGPEFKAYSKDPQTIFISSTPFAEVDKERDPRNICKTPRQHHFVAIVHTSKVDHNNPEYLILANIRNLCDYGDVQAKRLGSK